METIKKLWINEDGTPFTTHYNGSWNVIKMETTDNLDYSIDIYDIITEGVYEAEQQLERELTNEEYNEEVSYILENIAEYIGFELITE